jgi:hypothetical protein
MTKYGIHWAKADETVMNKIAAILPNNCYSTTYDISKYITTIIRL